MNPGEMVYTADNFCIVRVGSFLVLLSKYGFSFSGNMEDWESCLNDLKAADHILQDLWKDKGLPRDSENSPGHNYLVAKAAECAWAYGVEWFE